MPAATPSTTPARSRRRIRWRAVFKWSGLAVCVLLVVVLVVSFRWHIERRSISFTLQEATEDGWIVERGSFACWTGATAPRDVVTIWAWHVGRPIPLKLLWWPRLSSGQGRIVLSLPLWLPFTALAIPTALLFHLDRRSARRARTGQCIKCGYDLAGIAPAAVCPECGAPASPQRGAGM